MSKYKVVFNRHYKWVVTEEAWSVEADSEEQALELVNSGEGEYVEEDTVLVNTDKLVSDEHIYTEKIEEDE